MPARRARLLILRAAAALALLPLLTAPKCIEYEAPPEPDAGPPDAGRPDAGGDGGKDAGPPRPDAGPPRTVEPAVPCPSPDEARFLVRNFEYDIQCGCAEAEGRTCTINAGTTVYWAFADAVEHNVASLEDAFGRSTDRLSGRFTHTFEAPGSFAYGCTLHPREMSGYAILVE